MLVQLKSGHYKLVTQDDPLFNKLNQLIPSGYAGEDFQLAKPEQGVVKIEMNPATFRTNYDSYTAKQADGTYM